MNTGPTEPFTTAFGVIPRPEEPARRADPPPPVPQYMPSHPQYAALSPSGPTATATVVNNIRVGGGGYRRCNHLLHGTLTIATCGLWAPIWFLAWLSSHQH